MPKNSEISSTEKLLDLIRGKKNEGTPIKKPTASPPPLKAPLRFSVKRGIAPKSTVLGVDIGHEYLRLVKTGRSMDNKWQVLDYKKVPLPAAISKSSTEFIDFLRTEITNYGGIAKDYNIWLLMSAGNVDVRNIRIPKVSKSEIENAVFWSLKKEASFDEKENLFDFEVQGDVVDQGIPKMAVMAYMAPKGEIQEAKRMFLRAGMPLTGLTITPFAVQNILRAGWVPVAEETVASLFIGHDFSRIDIYAGGNLVMTRGIKAGMSSMVESLMEGMNEKRPAAPVSIEQARKVLYSLGPDSPSLSDKDPGFGLDTEEIFKMIMPALERMTRQVERTFEHYTSTLGNPSVGKIFVSGTMNVYKPLMDYVGNQLGIPSDIFDPMDPRVSGITSPDGGTVSERISFVPALGLALSDNAHTPNMIHTFKEKQVVARVALINRMILAATAVAVIICSGILLYQWGIVSQKKTAITKIGQELAQFTPRTDRAMISDMLNNAKGRLLISKSYSERYYPLAVIGELSAITPSNISLISMKSSIPKPSAEPPKDAAKPAGPAPEEGVTIEGLVTGEASSLESVLFRYKMALEDSRMFKQVNIQKKDLEPFRKGQVLHFIINMQIG